MGKEIKGSLTIEADSEKFYCYLRFNKKDDGLTVNRELINDVLSANGIKQDPEPGRIKEFLEKCAATSEQSFKFLFCEGIRPEPPFGEQFIWDKNAVPEDKKVLLEAVKQKAPVPEIFDKQIVTKEVKETVTKKGGFPFSQNKTETVSRQVKKEIKKKIDVSPEVEKYSWVFEGSKIARIRKGVPGKDGMDIYGNIIHFSGTEEIKFYLSDQFRKDRENLYAKTSGFLRTGQNWADIIEITENEWELTPSGDNVNCFIRFKPALYGKDIPDTAEIFAAAEDLGFKKETLVSEEELAKLLGDSLESGSTLDNVSISKNAEGFFKIDISEDSLKAVLHIRKGRGQGRQITLKEIGQAILDSKIKGYNQKKIQEDLAKFNKSNVLELKDYVLVEGKAPENTESRPCHLQLHPQDDETTKRIKAEATQLPEAYTERYPSLKEFSWKDVGHMALVKKGEIIARFDPEKRASPGRDVFGNTIEAPAAAKADIKVYENIVEDNDALVSKITGILDLVEDDDGNHKFRVRQHRDCAVHVEISGNKMAARISMIKEFGTGRRLEKNNVLQEIEKAGVKFGIIDSILDKAIEIAKKKGKILHTPFAKGKPAKNASEKGIRFFVEFEDKKKVHIRNDGSADYKDRGDVTNVVAGQKIAELPGGKEEVEDGSDVCGNRIAARQSVINQLQLGKNVEKKEHEGVQIILAKISGELVYEKNLLDVSSAHFIKGNVDMKTGNIKYPGDVKVAGMVVAGFYIMAGGNVQIGQGVERSLVSSDGSIEIAQGVVGGKKAVIRAKENISAVFSEQATLLSVGDINIQKSCLHCNVKTNGKLNLLSEKGYLIGGHILTRSGMNVMNIGNEQGTKTKISFGQDYLVADQIQLEEREVDKLKVKIVEIDKKMKGFIDAGTQDKLDQARKEKLKCMKLLESRNVRLFTLRERYEEHCTSEVIVRGTLYPGTQFESHGRFFEVNNQKSAVCIYFNPEVGHIEERPISTN